MSSSFTQPLPFDSKKAMVLSMIWREGNWVEEQHETPHFFVVSCY